MPHSQTPPPGDHPQAESLGALRATDAAWAPDSATGFADGFPLLLTSTVSLADLNARSATSIPMNRFRGNVVAQGLSHAWEEDEWKTVEIGGARFNSVKPCGRCTMPAVDQATGKSEGSTSSTLAALQQARKGEGLGWEHEELRKEVFFGVNMVPVAGDGMLRVGDAICMVEQRSSW